MSSDAVPEGRCGFVLEPGDLPEQVPDANMPPILFGESIQNHDVGPDEWYADSGAVCCWREVWDGADDGRCIWHAETDAKSAEALIDARADGPERLDGAYVPAVELDDAIDFEGCRLYAATFDGTGLRGVSFAGVGGWRAQFPDADLRETQFPDADLQDAQFPDADFREAQFPGTDLRGAQFPDAFLRWAQFNDAVLAHAQFNDAHLYRTQFNDADLANAQFNHADLRFAQLTDADLQDATFTGARLGRAELTDANFSATDLRGASLAGAHMNLDTIEEGRAEFDGATVFGWSQLEVNEKWERAARKYRSFQQTLRERAMPGEVPRYRVREMHARRKAAFPWHPIQWLKLALARWTALYGESPYRVVYTSLAIILGWTLLYPRAGGIRTTADPDAPVVAVEQTLALPDAVATGLEPWLTSFYFSVVTFTTLGYGDLQPASPTAQLLATVESFVGALLMALLVYVLGRRATR